MPPPPPRRRKKESFNPFMTAKSEAKARPTALLPGQRPHPTGALANTTANGSRHTSSLADINRKLTEATPEGPYVDIPVVTTKRALIEGMRHHVMRFIPNPSARINDVNPMDPEQFERPVRLHRRDPRHDNRQRDQDEDEEEEKEEIKPDLEQQKERERVDAAKAERRAEREANQAQIAPSTAKPKDQKQKQKPKKATEQVFQINDSERKKKEMALRYEEAIPWHIEDFDGKNIWRGTYESALSNCHVAFIPESDPQDPQASRMRMIPIEKWYKFTHKSDKKKIMTIDEAEKQMKSRIQPDRWVLVQQQKDREAERERKMNERKTFAVARERKSENLDHAADIDDIDYDERDEFADDEDANIFEGQDDEDAKEANERIKREQQEANFFDNKEEKDYDREEEAEREKKEEEKKVQKKMSKALKEREKNYDYEEDSDGNPYLSESSEESEELERADNAKQTQAKPDTSPAPKGVPMSMAAQASAAAAAQKKASSNVPSRTGSPAVGSSANKAPESLRKNVLKRPGSPTLSDASGNESARKRQKLKKGIKQESTGSAAPSRPGSPPSAVGNSKLSATRRAGAASGSEGDTTDASKSKSKKRKADGTSARVASGVGSPDVSPPASRPGSPLSATQQAEGNQSPNGNESGSQQAKKKVKKSKPLATLPTTEELRAAVPPNGILLTDLMQKFPVQSKVHGFADLIRANATFHKNIIRLKNP